MRLRDVIAACGAVALAGFVWSTAGASMFEEEASPPAKSAEDQGQTPVHQVAPSVGVYVPDIGTLVPDLRNLVPDPLPGEEAPVLTEPPPPPPPSKKVQRPRYDNKTQAQINNAKARSYLVGKADASAKKAPIPCNTINIGTVGDGTGAQTSSAVTTGNISSVSSGCK